MAPPFMLRHFRPKQETWGFQALLSTSVSLCTREPSETYSAMSQSWVSSQGEFKFILPRGSQTWPDQSDGDQLSVSTRDLGSSYYRRSCQCLCESAKVCRTAGLVQGHTARLVQGQTTSSQWHAVRTQAPTLSPVFLPVNCPVAILPAAFGIVLPSPAIFSLVSPLSFPLSFLSY